MSDVPFALGDPPVTDPYCYTFQPDVNLDDVDSALLLAMFAVESLHGAQAFLDHNVQFDRDERKLFVEARTDSQKDCNRILAGYLRAELGDEGFDVDPPGFPSHR